MKLESLGIPLNFIDRIYRALYTHSVGFYQLLIECSIFLEKDKRADLLINIWRVFQILLQYSCPTDFKMITAHMEKKRLDDVNKLEAVIKEMNDLAGKKEQIVV